MCGGKMRVLFIAILISFQVGAHEICPGFIEKNDLRIPVGSKFAGATTEQQFNAAIDKVLQVYTPIFQQRNQRLRVKKLWSNSQVNAVAYIENGTAVIEIWGGLARHSAVTADAVTLVTCHEIGHHIGGAPKYSDNNGSWAAVEGQSDYFATMKCLRKVFRQDMSGWNEVVPATVRQKCSESHGVGSLEEKICQRIALASLSSANLSAALTNVRSPTFDSRDATQVTKTFEKHPAAQCRLDTYMNGNVCKVSDAVDMDARDLNKGVCRNTPDEEYGARSRCWYKPVASTPTPRPPPTNGVAATPLLNGLVEVGVGNPNQPLVFSWDVSRFPQAAGVYYEVIGPNRDFRQPHGRQPDSASLVRGSIAQPRGQFVILPARQLPGWGVYRFRVIPLDRSGRQAVGEFSRPAILRLETLN